MKVSVITRHAITNYGSLLQALATQVILERLGVECEIVDYIREDESYKKLEITLLKRKQEWYNNPVKRTIYLALRQPESVLAGYKFEKQRNKLLKLSRKYTSLAELEKRPPDADIYLTGSDQVWGPMADGTFDSTYCLSYVPEGKKRIAYAASFGYTQMEGDLKNYYRKLLSQYNAITVREDSAKEMLRSIDIMSEQVIDPTLLLSQKDWETYIESTRQRNYVLVYQLHNDPRVGAYAEKYAKEKGLLLLRISPSIHQITRPGKLIWCPTIGEFLGYIQNAECLITDSFHGTVFAINFNVPFVEVLPTNGTKSRNVSILSMLSLKERILDENNGNALLTKQIDYAKVNCLLEKERMRSFDILKQLLS